ncbi:phosphoenolpyruvate--protein phosphotransferase [Vandammella animalimorsus]|uniref:phosphoenolpyruvate--protein phosphotransferase n=1 Tax=Vandammella animalimorsus TaxID=2029117 RepID=UPI0031BBB9B2
MKPPIQGIAVSSGIAIGRALLLGKEPLPVQHYLVGKAQVARELQRLEKGFALAIGELRRVQHSIAEDPASNDLHALLDVHAMLLEDEALQQGAAAFVRQRRYNAEWALMQQLAQYAREFDAMDDDYLRERKTDLEQLVARVVQCIQAQDRQGRGQAAAPPPGALGAALSSIQQTQATLKAPTPQATQQNPQQASQSHPTAEDLPLIVVAHELAPADMLHFRQNIFAGFVVDTGGATSHTAIVARSLDIPAVVGAKDATSRVTQDCLLIVHADAGQVIVNPDAATLAHYRQLQQQLQQVRQRRQRLRYTPAITHDGQGIELLANIELPGDCAAALNNSAVGVGLFRSEFLFMGRQGTLPDEQEQYRAYRDAMLAMQGLPVTIRTVDIGADKALDGQAVSRQTQEHSALGLRAIRWSLASPAMFRTQLRALLRAAVHGPLRILFPMLGQRQEIQQALAQLELAREELRASQTPFGPVLVGAMIEVPAAALTIDQFLQHFDFVSLGTNDLTQYTLAVDRADESVAHLFDATHPAVLQLIAHVIQRCQARGKPVCVCGEIAGEPELTELLLGLGLRSFSMHPAQILAVKERILLADTQTLQPWARSVLQAEDPKALLQQSPCNGPEAAPLQPRSAHPCPEPTALGA